MKRLTDRAEQRAMVNADRPRLKPFVGFDGRTVRETDALRSIQAMVADARDEQWFSVGVLPIPAIADAMFLEHISHPTLEDLLRDRRVDDERLETACRAAGAWLRSLHRLPTAEQSVSRLGSRHDVDTIARTLLDHVASHVDEGAGRFAPALHRTIEQLPETLPLVPAHADFAAHNVFVDEAGAVAVFDTALDCSMPPHYDLAYFSAMLDFADLRRVTPSLRTRDTGGLRAALVDGYGPTAPPEAELRAFEVAILFEKWGNFGEGRHGSPVRRAAKALRSTLLQRRLRQVVLGLLEH